MISSGTTFSSLRSRLMLLVALAILPCAALTLYSGWQQRQHAIEIEQDDLQRLTNLAAVNESESLQDARRLLMDLSNIPELLDNQGRCSQLLRTLLAKNPEYSNLGVIQLNGDVTCSAVPSAVPVNLGDRDHFKRAISERRFIAGNYVFGRVIRRHTINLTYPVTNAKGEVAAVVFAALDLAAIDKFINGIDLPAGSVLITSDEVGNIISRRPNPEKWLGNKVPAEIFAAMKQPNPRPQLIEDSDGVVRLHTFARVGTPDVSNFVVTIGIPNEDIIASARQDQLLGIAMLLATAALALLATWFAGEVMIVRRTKALVRTAERLAAGDMAARTDMPYGSGELSYLAHAIDQMAHALDRRRKDRERAEEDLRVAARRKDEFLAMLAHELRNPLAPISNAARVLKLIKTDEPRVHQTSDIIARQVAHMTGLINDLLDVSRVTRGMVTLKQEALDLRQVANAAVEQARPLIESRRHRLQVKMPSHAVWVHGDMLRLIQVVANLLNNAAKYTPEGGNILLWIASSDSECLLGINDDGIGIDADLLPHVFELFSQADRTPDRSQGGLGLGLALVKSLAELHGGSVVAHSAGVGKGGSEFVLHLPRLHDVPEQRPPAAPGAAQIAESGLPVMVVDDNDDAADTLAMLLEQFGYRVSVTYDAQTALDRIHSKEFVPRILLLDIGLPDMDGYALAQAVRRMPQTEDAVLIALTGYGHEKDRERTRAAGFDHHVVKPAEPADLAALLEQAALQVNRS